jgi:hypothetical protein
MAHIVHPEFQRRHAGARRGAFRRVLSHYQLIELTVLIGGILLLWGGSSLLRISSRMDQGPSAWVESVRIDIIDGDSIRTGNRVYRLVGFNTPESGDNARCAHERALAGAATQRLRQLVAAGDLDLRRVPCACAPGTEGTGQCNYGRLCGTLKVHGRDVGAILIGEGLAERYLCQSTSCPPRKNWCLS